MLRFFLAIALAGFLASPVLAQYGDSANTSGGPLKPEQAAFDVTFYDLRLAIDPESQSIEGTLTMHARIVHPTNVILLDLDDALTIENVSVRKLISADAIIGHRESPQLRPAGIGHREVYLSVPFDHSSGQVRVQLDRTMQPGEDVALTIRYGGSPVEAARPPWDGGFTWAETEDGRPWIAVSCQGEGADLWWPVKDHPSDEPDSMRIALTVPIGLRAIANGRHQGRTDNGNGTVTEEWFVSTPINNYGVSFGVGPYEEVTATYESPYGYTMPVTFYVLPENKADAERQLPGFLDAINFLERTFGPYGFRDDGYKILHTPYLGMEHQSLIAYGSTFEDNEYGFDWLHFHELTHEWWGNLGTAPDWNDFWIHESFANFAEALYAEDIARRNGEDSDAAYLRYIATVRGRISNVLPVAPRESRSTKDMYTLPDGGFNGDIYFKGSWFLHTLRYLIDEDEAFFRALRRIMYPDPALEAATDGSANHFITTVDVQAAFEAESRMDLSVYFEVYLRQPVLPRLVVVPALDDRATLRWELPDGILAEEQTFDLPVEVDWGTGPQRIEMTGGQGSIPLTAQIDPNDRILIVRDSTAVE